MENSRTDGSIGSERSLSGLFEKTTDLICSHDLEGRILSVNAAACRATGRSREQLLTMSIQDLLAPAFRDEFESYISSLTRDGNAAGMMLIKGAAGRERVLEYRNTLMVDDQERPVVWGIARDVTKRERALGGSRRSDLRLRTIIENISDVIAVIDVDGRLVYHTQSLERALGYAGDVLIGSPFSDLVHTRDSARWMEFLVNQIADAGAVRTIELQLRHHDGTWRSFEIVCKDLVEHGQLSAVLLNARDISDRKLLEAQLAQAERLNGLGKLAATVAHEFNNVLMGMQPFAELIMRPNAAPAMIARSASHIANSIQRGKRVALDILRFTQPAQPVMTSFDLGEFWQTFAPEAEGVIGNMIRIVSRIPFRGLRVSADKSQLAQVLLNLVTNARDAMPGGGTLTIQAGIPEEHAFFPFGIVSNAERFVHISVTDSGMGMPPDVLEHAFDPLFTTKRGGNGLGLAVAHQVMKQHGGHIFAESELGGGTAFHLFLQRGNAEERKPEEVTSERTTRARRILIVEDEAVIAEGLSLMLSSCGFEVQTARFGGEAAGLFSAFRPHVVVLDLGLPDMDGTEVYSRIRKIDESVPVIFASGHGDRRAIQNEIPDSRIRFLQKPFEFSALTSTIADVMRAAG